MIALLQRVSEARVKVGHQTVGEISFGVLALIGVEKGDSPQQAERLLNRTLGYRLFPDARGRMNLGLRDTGGGLLLVPQFTLAADTGKGLRPGFAAAAEPAQARECFDYLVELAVMSHQPVASGVFGADMAVSLVNQGPVTFYLRV
ncbi:D-aminoacyl-tRNA deacylase [Acidihalobacter prosperus]